MSDIRFHCAHCHQSLEAPDDMAGTLVECPSCKKPIEVPLLPPPPQADRPKFAIGGMSEAVSAADAAAAARKCPQCQAPLEPGTVLCLRCGYHTKLGKKLSTDLT